MLVSKGSRCIMPKKGVPTLAEKIGTAVARLSGDDGAAGATTLANLAKTNTTCHKIKDAGAISPLVVLLDHPDTASKAANALGALMHPLKCKVYCHQEMDLALASIRAEVARAGAIPKLVAMLPSSDSAADASLGLARHGPNAVELLEAGALGALSKRLAPGCPESVPYGIDSLLEMQDYMTFDYFHHIVAQCVEDGVVCAVSKCFVQSKRSTAHQEDVASAIAHLACDGPHQSKVRAELEKCGAIAKLHQHVQDAQAKAKPEVWIARGITDSCKKALSNLGILKWHEQKKQKQPKKKKESVEQPKEDLAEVCKILILILIRLCGFWLPLCMQTPAPKKQKTKASSISAQPEAKVLIVPL